MKVHFENLVFDPANTGREIDKAHVKNLAEKIAKYGLLTSLTVRRGAKPDGVQQYIVTSGGHRYEAIELLQGLSEAELIKLGTHYNDDNQLVPGRSFEELFPEEKVEVICIDSSLATAATSVENTARKDFTQSELCHLVWKLAEEGIDQHEIAARCNLNQGRISEFLVMRKCIPQAHDAWDDGLIALRDMLALASLSEDKQKDLLGKLLSAGGKRGEASETAPSSVDPKAAKAAKTAARKELQGAAKDTKRVYANAGKPTRKRLNVISERVAVAAKKGDEQSKSVFEIVDLVFGFVDGKLDEKAFGKKLSEYGVLDVLTDPEPVKPVKEPKPAKTAKVPKDPKPEPEKKPEPVKAEKAKPSEKLAKPAKAAKKAAKSKPAKKAAKSKPAKAAKKAKKSK